MPRAVPRLRADELAAVAVGGAAGGLLRWLVALWGPGPGWVPALVVNVTGSLAIGVLMVLTAERGHRLWRPLLGVGLLGGFTTFSTYAVDVVRLTAGDGAAGLALLVATPVLAVAAAATGARLARRAVGRTARPASPGGRP